MHYAYSALMCCMLYFIKKERKKERKKGRWENGLQ
ncbi:hypothetical protein CS5676_0035 [Clostridium phage phiCs5676-1]|nr:hypothetical protein CS5676_0035 [Clostridium phage phiCs5676-1]